MGACHHLEPQRLDGPAPRLDSFRLKVVPELGEKARSFPKVRLIEVDKRFWSKLTPTQKAALMAHELAHFEPGPARCDTDNCIPCENCADRRGGAIMAAFGFTLPSTIGAARHIIDTRGGAPHAYREGWQAWHAARRKAGR